MSGQNYDQYSAADHDVWKTLCQRQLTAIHESAYAHFPTGLSRLGVSAEQIPAFEELNGSLQQLTGWKIYAVPGLIANRAFFKLMAFRRFGATTWIRRQDQLDYLEEPDIFHDVFGHIPLLADPAIADYLHRLALIAERYINDEQTIEQVARLYWYTIEFGLVREQDQVRIYGAGILSSIGETAYCLSPAARRIPFNLRQILRTPYLKDKYQEQYFVLDSMDQLAAAIPELDAYLRAKFN